MFAQQAQQMRRVTGRLGGAQCQFALRGCIAPGVHAPHQHQRQHTAMAQLQPDLQLIEQAVRAKQKCLGRLNLGRQFQRGIKRFGQRQPGVELGRQSISAV